METNVRIIETPQIPILLDEHDIVILPQMMDDDVGLYPHGTLVPFKELLQEGADIAYLHSKPHRQFLTELSVPTFVIDILIGLGTDTVVAVLQSWLVGRHDADNVRLRVVRRKHTSGEELETIEVSGNGEAVARALAALPPGSPPDAK